MGKFLRELFLVAPDFQFERAVHCFKPAHKRCGAPPSAFFVETRCAVVADGTGKPPGLDAGRGKLFLRIRDQRRSNAGAPHFGRYIKLLELVALRQRKPCGALRGPAARTLASEASIRRTKSSSVRARTKASGRIAACASCQPLCHKLASWSASSNTTGRISIMDF
jgi:hypothetical protein